MLNVIGLHGRIGSGKDALAEVLVKEFGFTRVAFGDAVKREAEDTIRNWRTVDMNVFPLHIRAILERAFSTSDFEGPWRKPTSSDMRELLQWWGTEYRRRQDPDYWVEAPRLGKLPKKVVFTDVRFVNEMATVKALGGEAWMIERDVDLDSPAAEHISEQLADLVGRAAFDRIVSNNGTLEELQKTVREIMAPPKPKPAPKPAAAPKPATPPPAVPSPALVDRDNQPVSREATIALAEEAERNADEPLPASVIELAQLSKDIVAQA